MEKSITIPIFKKGNYKGPSDYTWINLIASTTKLVKHILKLEIEKHIEISDEQQGFSQNRSTTGAVFDLKQIQAKSMEYHHLTFMFYWYNKGIVRPIIAKRIETLAIT